MRYWLALLLAAMSGITACSPSKPAHPALASLPADMLWAWERSEDLRWLPDGIGVAYVASSIKLDQAMITITPRANPLKLKPATKVVPVVHVDAAWGLHPVLNTAQKEAVVAQVLKSAQGYRVVQLDFEVLRSQRAFLQQVVQEIRTKLPADTALSMTALASWCSGDYWLQEIAADEIVPMAFRMGPEQQIIRQQLARDQHFPHAKCNLALGYASDEVLIKTQAQRRYYFSPQAWTPARWQATQANFK